MDPECSHGRWQRLFLGVSDSVDKCSTNKKVFVVVTVKTAKGERIELRGRVTFPGTSFSFSRVLVNWKRSRRGQSK